MAIIELDRVTKEFSTLRGRRVMLGKGGLSDWVRGKRHGRFAALKDVSFSIEPGESVGIIGANGSGKSTLLKIIAGVTVPSGGAVRVYGKVASLLELGAGFHPLLTGRENVYLNAQLLGMRRPQIDAVMPLIIEFSGIEEFIDQPVETYSSGMYVRLGFAVAVHTNPDIFLVDEVLAVGDEEFQQRCRARITELQQQGKTIVFVSHDLGIVQALCNRVILLQKGTLVSRRTPQDTIDFYLRQVGRDRGIHRIADGDAEAILSHGRVSLFHHQREVSAPAGFQVHVQSMGHWHPSTAAQWEIGERTDSGCAAQGTMPRLPLVHRWKASYAGGKLVWSLALEVTAPVSLEAVEVNLFFPLAYTRWMYGGQQGEFPELQPQDRAYLPVTSPDPIVRDVAAFSEDPDLRTAVLTMQTDSPYLRLQWANTDFVTGCRVLQAGGPIPAGHSLNTPGVHPLMTLTVDLERSNTEAEAIANEYAQGTGGIPSAVVQGEAKAAFRGGEIHLLARGRELSRFPHGYTSMLINGLWANSQNLLWETPLWEGNRMRITGKSRRFGFSQIWELAPAKDGIAWRILLDVREPFDVQEYHASLVLVPDYQTWSTDWESGTFPDFGPGDEEWRHHNRDYRPGQTCLAAGPGLPSVALVSLDRAIPIRMTVLNTGSAQRGRVLQALRPPDRGTIRFAPGQHLYFAGEIRVTP
ncbi:MAG: hypothetical protein AMXMBFR84_41130 [Candidatus Hydrogenedentota bacterium]